jgi:hypothetical protein
MGYKTGTFETYGLDGVEAWAYDPRNIGSQKPSDVNKYKLEEKYKKQGAFPGLHKSSGADAISEDDVVNPFKGIKIKDFAKMVNQHESKVRRKIKGTTEMTRGDIINFASVLNLTTDEATQIFLPELVHDMQHKNKINTNVD